ncbi:MAG: hypothetical protein GYB68_03040 [Chloroflexi bacterium]|nr:hypothetical protein [Chloroflexota bacterium]
MDTPTLKQILLDELRKYAKRGLNATSYLMHNEAEQIYAVVDIAMIRGKRSAGTALIARLAGERIVIELDRNDKELVDALKARDVPADQIILAYRGELMG